MYDPACQRCPLHTGARSICIPGRGSLSAEYLFVVAAPSASDEAEGTALRGLAGEGLDSTLKDAGLADAARMELLVRCRPPGGRNPTKKELTACDVFTQRVIASMPNLKVIVPLGNESGKWFGMRSNILKYAGIPLVAQVRDFGDMPHESAEKDPPVAGGGSGTSSPV